MTRLLTNRVQIALSVLALGLVGLAIAGAPWAGAVAAAGVAGLAMALASRGRQQELVPIRVRRNDRRGR